MFYQNYSLALHTVEISCYLIFKKSEISYKVLPYYARINFMIHWTRKMLELPYWTRIGFMIYWK